MRKNLFATIFLLFPLLAHGQNDNGAVTGTLRFGNGAPAAGIRVAAMPVPREGDNTGGSTLVALSRTDATGTYRLENIPPGRYHIFAGLIDSPNYYPGARTTTDARVLVVEAGSTLRGIDFPVSSTSPGSVAGRLSEPVFADVTLYPSSRNIIRTTLQTATDDKGVFLFDQVQPGTYTLSSSLSSQSLPLTVNGDVANIVLPVVLCKDGVEIRGRLLSAPASSVNRIELRGKRAGCIPQARVNADGSFLIRGVARDVYTVYLAPPPLRGFSGMKITVEDQDLTVDIPLRNLDVRGRITFENGIRPPTDTSLRVYAQRIQNNEVLAQTPGSGGAFSFQLAEGSHDFSVSAPLNYVVKSISYGDIDLLQGPLKVEEVLTGEIRIVLGFDEELEPGFRISGRVVPSDVGGAPRPSRILLVSAQGNPNTLSIEATLAPDGSFVFRGIDPGRYNLKTTPDSPALREIVLEQSDLKGLEIAAP